MTYNLNKLGNICVTEPNPALPGQPTISPSSSPSSKAPGVVVCAKCGSLEIRESRDAKIRDFFARLIGKFPYRCRTCRARFYAKSARLKPLKERSHKRPIPFWRRPRTRKMVVESIIIIISLLVFGAFLYFLSKTGSQPSQ